MEIPERSHLDVRNKDEWKKTGIVEGAVTIPLKKLKDRAHEVKGLNNIVVNCKTGMRARFAMSILANAGIKAVVMAESNLWIYFRGLIIIEDRVQDVAIHWKASRWMKWN